MSAIVEFLFPAPASRSVGSIVRWWEARRPVFNAAVGAAGLVSVGAVTVASLLFGDPVGLQILGPVVVFGVMANVCYLLGPAAELLIDRAWGRKVLPAGPTLFRMGLTFSVGLALFPALLVVLFTIARVIFAPFF